MAAQFNQPYDPSPEAENGETFELSERLAYLELNAADAATLRRLSPVLNQFSTTLVENFYKHLLAFPQTANHLQDPVLVARLKVAQQQHFQSMLDAQWDQQYVERRRRVGDVHAQVGIEPVVFLGAYNQYILQTFRHLAEQSDPAVERFVADILPLIKGVFLDVGLTLDAYFLRMTQTLRQALEMLYRANAELRQFAQLTSHDLKTPLATVANLCDEAIDEFGERMPSEARRLITAARARAFKMSATIDELLSSSLLLHAERSPTETVLLGKIVHDAVEPLRAALDEKGIILRLEANLPAVYGDAVRLREAFYNLISNAIKFIERKPGRITVSSRQATGECEICVADNGPGIPPEELDRIFVPFRRLQVHREKPGSGLGLYFTKCIVEQQGGKIWVESELGHGSRFFIRLRCPQGESE